MRGICQKCGRAPKIPGQGRRYCVDCKEAAEWAAARKRQTRLIVERLPCIRCGGVKEPGKGRDLCLKCKEKIRPKRICMSCPTEIQPPARKCKACRAKAFLAKREYERERHRRNRKLHPEWYANRPRRAKDNEGARMRHRLREERKGRVVPPVAKLPTQDVAYHVPTAPLVPLIREFIAEHDITTLGEASHVRPATLQAVLDGRLQTLRDFQADRLCVALGTQLSYLYRDLAQTG